MRKQVYFLLGAMFLYAQCSFAQTVVQGNVSGQWTKAGSPYKIIIGDVTIPAGQTLTIDPGVVIQIDLGLNFKIDGTLNAIGTQSDTIRFTTAQASPAIGQWGAIIVSGTATVAYAVIEYGNGSANNLIGAISALNGSAKLQIHNSFMRLNIDGAEILGTNSKISNSRIENCSSWGLHLGLGAAADSMSLRNNANGISDAPNIGGDILITNSIVQGSNAGLFMDDGGKCVIKKCTFTKNNNGIVLGNNSSSASSINVDSSTISQNIQDGVFIVGGNNNQFIRNSLITQNQHGIYSSNSTNMQVYSSIIAANTLEGINKTTYNGGITILKSEISYNGGDGGVSTAGSLYSNGNNISQNSGHGVNAYGIEMDSSVIIGNGKIGVYSSVNYPISIRRTVISRNGQAGLSNIGSNSTVENNTIVSNAGGIENINSNTGVIIRNNIVSNNSGNGLHLLVSPAPSVRFNLVNSNTVNWNGFATSFGNTSLGFFNKRGAASDPFSNIDINPQFQKPDSNNFALLFNSPAISAGDTLSPKNPDSSYADMGTIPYPRKAFAPLNLSAIINRATVNLSWQNGGGASTRSYRIYRGGDPSKMFLVDSAKSTTHQDSILYLPPKTYYFVTAVDSLSRESNVSNTAVVQNGTLAAGNAVKLNASWIDVGGKGAVDASQIFTLEAWIYQTSIVPSSGSRIIDNNREGESDSWTFDLIGGNRMRFISGPYPGYASYGQTPITLNEWHHVAAVINASIVQLYLDGKLDGQGTRSGTWNDVSFEIRIGSYIASGLGTMDEYFYGSMDEVRMWNKALSQREIQSRMYRPLTGSEPNLAAYFTMDQTGSGAFVNVTNNSLNANRTNDGVTHSNGTLEFVTSTAPISQIATLALNTTPIDFGPVKLNTTKNLNLRMKAQLGSVKITSVGFLHNVFSVTPTSGGLNAGDSLLLTFMFNPKQYGSYVDTLIIQSNANSGIYSIPVSGTSPQPTMILSSPSIQFNSATYGDTLFKRLQIKQSTVNTLIIDSVYTKTNIFSVNKNSANVDDSLDLTIALKAPNYGKYVDTLYLRNNSTTSLAKIPLVGNLPFPIIFTGAALNYGNVAVGDSTLQMLLLGNTYQGDTEIDSIFVRTKQYTVSPRKAMLKATDTLRLIIQFKPDGFKTFADTVFVRNKTQNTIVRIALTGASPSPTIFVDATQVQFGSAKKDSSVFRTIAITNTSINDLFIDSFYTATAAFTVTGTSFSHLVRRGDSLIVTLRFVSSIVGTHKDTLLIRNNSLTSPLMIALSGTATPTNGVERERAAIPTEYSLSQNFPNPFNPSTTITFGLPEQSRVSLILYDVIGREVSEIVREDLQAGYYSMPFNANYLSSGVYFYRLFAVRKSDESHPFVETKKLLLIK